jgi:hypothetical protein
VFGGGNHNLEYTFLVFLTAPIIAGLLALTALRTYPRELPPLPSPNQRSKHQYATK